MTKENRKVLIIAVTIIIFFAIAVGVRISLAPEPLQHGDSADGDDVAEGVAEIQALSDRDITEIESKLQLMERFERIEQIQAGNLNVIFENAMIMGDSHAEGISVYGHLDESRVAAVKGHNLSNCSDDVEKVIKNKPQVLFINYGMNDVGIYGTNIAGFTSAYEDLITEIKENLPDTRIYVCSIFEVQQEAIADKPYLAYIPDYNAALAEMCSGIDTGFIDTSMLLTDEYYEPDHIHTNSAYHKLWLNYIASEAGLLKLWTAS